MAEDLKFIPSTPLWFWDQMRSAAMSALRSWSDAKWTCRGHREIQDWPRPAMEAESRRRRRRVPGKLPIIFWHTLFHACDRMVAMTSWVRRANALPSNIKRF